MEKRKKVLLIGSNFLASQVFVRLCGFNNLHIIVMDRRDPSTIQIFNQDTYRIMRRYWREQNYMDLYSGNEFGDPKRNLKISFLLKDYVNESLKDHPLLADLDIAINCGSIYDNLYAQSNRRETLNVNIMGMLNLMNNLPFLQKTGERKTLFVQMSSINVYGDQSKNPKPEVTEDTYPEPRGLLNYSLCAQESLLRALAPPADIDWMIFRLGTLIGDFTPVHSLVNNAVKTLLMEKPEFEIYNHNESIEFLDMLDLGILVDTVYQLHEANDERYSNAVNQIYNIKSDEDETKTVGSTVNAIFGAAVRLPQITNQHVVGANNFRLRTPKLKYMDAHRDPWVYFDKPVSIEKAKTLLKFDVMKPLIFSMLPTTVHYLLTYVLGDLGETKRQIYTKMFNLPSTPTPETVDDSVNKDVKDAVGSLNADIERGFDEDISKSDK